MKALLAATHILGLAFIVSACGRMWGETTSSQPSELFLLRGHDEL